MPRHCAKPILAIAAMLGLAAAVGGCSRGEAVLDDLKEISFQKPTFNTPNWAVLQKPETAQLGPRGPVPPEQLVDTSGHCAAPAQPAETPRQAAAPSQAAEPETASNAEAPAQSPGEARVGSIAGDLASAPMRQGPPPAAPKAPQRTASDPRDLGGLQPEVAGPAGVPVAGGVALGMTECEAVRRVGQPSQVTVATGDQGVRKVVLTYASGPRSGVYTFEAGRLKVIDALPAESPPAKPQRKTPRKPARTAGGERVYVR